MPRKRKKLQRKRNLYGDNKTTIVVSQESKLYPPIRPSAALRGTFAKAGTSAVSLVRSVNGYEAASQKGHSAPIYNELEGYSKPKRYNPGWAWKPKQ